MSAKPEADPQLGRTLGGQYRIEALLGAGGMGRVYRGRQLSVNRPVAIKVIAGQAPYPPEWVRRFRREAEATASLSHPNSVRLFDFGVTESEELFMVMELLEGNDLARQLQAHGPMPLVTVLAIARQVLLALCEAHALGITHRDIKPDNIFLASVRGADVVAKVMDFGIAGIAQAQRKSRLTGAGMIIGTPMYMSPEQAQGLPVDGKSDVYSLGVVLFEMLTGRPVFESHTAVTLLLAHVARAPMRLDEAGVQLREQSSLQALLDRLLAKDPNERPTAAEALETVTALSTRLGVAGATGSMRAIDSDATATPKPKARRGKSPSAAGRAAAAASRSSAQEGAAPSFAADGSQAPDGAQQRQAPGHATPPSAAVSSASSAAQLDIAVASSRAPLQAAPDKELEQRSADHAPLFGASDVATRGSPEAEHADDAEARSARQFERARAASAPTGAWLRPGFVLLGTALVLGAASALALRWGPTLIDATQPATAMMSAVAARDPRTVLIDSQPSGAHVLLEGEKVGTTPYQLEVRGDTEISVARDGYVRQLVQVPYEARAPLLVKLAVQPVDKPKARAPSTGDDKPFALSLRQESHPRIGPRADSDHERRERTAEGPRVARGSEALPGSTPRDRAAQPRAATLPTRAPSERSDENPPGRTPGDHATQGPTRGTDETFADSTRTAQPPADALPTQDGDETPQRGSSRSDGEHERRDDARAEEAHVERSPSGREPSERVDPERGVYGLSETANPRPREDDSPSTGLDVARVLEMGRQGHDEGREPSAAARAQDRERAAELASEHGPTRSLPPGAADENHAIAAIREDEVAEIALDDDERAHVAQHYGLRAIGRAVARAFGRLLIPYPNRERRAALARLPLMYPSFRDARAAYKSRDVDATGFQEAVWQLRERRRQKIWAERDRYARGELTQGQYEARVDRIWDEFWGQR